MKKRLLALLLTLATILGLFPGAAYAAPTLEEALGEIDVYHNGVELSYLSMYGYVRTMTYTYYNYETSSGEKMEIPVYCVDPQAAGVPNVVSPGQSVKYNANELESDPKVVGIIANGYPKRSLAELGLGSKEQGYYATKIALWCYIRPAWDIDSMEVNPALSGDELARGQAILAAAKDIYARGTAWNSIMLAKLTTTVDQEEAYPVTVDGTQYKQQVFTVTSDTWVRNYDVSVSFANPGSVPSGTRIVDMDNKDITAVTTQGSSSGYSGQFKVLYPLSSVEGKTGSVQLSLSADVYQYAIFVAVCAETQYGPFMQDYICDTDPSKIMSISAVSSYSDDDIPIPTPTPDTPTPTPTPDTPTPTPTPDTPTPTPTPTPSEMELRKR